jgi:hypothetical protein
LLRYVVCAGGVAAEPDMATEITCVYAEVLANPSAIFRKSHDAVHVAESIAAEKTLQVRQMVDAFDPVYRAARSVVLAILPASKLPDTLKKQPTETEVVLAIETLVSIVESHAGAAWSDTLMSGRFGTLAPKVQAAMTESDEARNALAKARQQRADAYGPAYTGYLAFKRVVRDVLGPSSRQYRKLHPRKSASQELETDEEVVPDNPVEEAAPDSGVMPASNGAPALTGGPLSVKVG